LTEKEIEWCRMKKGQRKEERKKEAEEDR